MAVDLIGNNPFAVLTFIAAPAILTNASSVSALDTSNRLARATERARSISTQLEDRANKSSEWVELHIRLLKYAEKRLAFIVKSLTAFYFSLGSFAAASLISVFGTGLFSAQFHVLGYALLSLAMIAWMGGVAGLVYGSWLLVVETRYTLRSLSEETRFIVTHHQQFGQNLPERKQE
jgi:Protein of unknown function (DUF2721)